MSDGQMLPSWTGGHFLPSAATKVEEGETVVVRPGDTLIMRTSAETRERLEELANIIRARLPEDVKLLLLAGVEQVLVYRPGGGA